MVYRVHHKEDRIRLKKHLVVDHIFSNSNLAPINNNGRCIQGQIAVEVEGKQLHCILILILILLNLGHSQRTDIFSFKCLYDTCVFLKTNGFQYTQFLPYSTFNQLYFTFQRLFSYQLSFSQPSFSCITSHTLTSFPLLPSPSSPSYQNSN